MHNVNSPSPNFRLAIAPGVPSSRFSALLALQREQEPEVAIALSKVSGEALIAELREGRYDAGMSLHGGVGSSLNSQPLWRERMAAAMPLRYPLLNRARLTIDDLLDYPVFRWPTEVCPALDQRMSSCSPGHPRDIRDVTSFELMALWVAAGYGVGVSAQSRIARARAWGICLRPLPDDPCEIVTHLLLPAEHHTSAAERFMRRALQVAETDTT